MKKYLILNIILVFTLPGMAQIITPELHAERDSIISKYVRHTDTITRNTWLNIMKSNKYMQQIIHYDSMIIQASAEQKDEDSLTNTLLLQLQEMKDKLMIQKQQKEQMESDLDFYHKMYYMALVLSALFLVIIIILILLTGRLNRTLKEKNKNIKEYYTGLSGARKEIEASRKTENQLASEINKLKKQLDGGEDDQKPALEKMSEEKLMLENQIVEVKKAYEMEASKRMELEAQLKEEQQNDDSELIERLTEQLENVQNEYDVLKAENEKAQQELASTGSKDDEMKTLKQNLHLIEKELASAEKKFDELEGKIRKISGGL